jgi:hypothetical protein
VQENHHAAQTNHRKSEARPPRGKIAQHSGGRIHQGRDGQNPQWPAWRPLPTASCCYRSLRGSASRRSLAAAEEKPGLGTHAQERHVRLRGGARQAQDPPPTARLARGVARAEARIQELSLARGTLAPVEARRRSPQQRISRERCAKSRTNQGSSGSLCRRAKSRAHSEPPQEVRSQSADRCASCSIKFPRAALGTLCAAVADCRVCASTQMPLRPCSQRALRTRI